MTVPAQTPINETAANGVTTVFPYTFLVTAASELLVQVDGVTKTLGVDYTVSGVGNNSGGNVTFTVAPANGTTVTRRRNMPLERNTGYTVSGDLKASVLNNDHDRHWLALQQLNALIGKSIQMPPGVTGGPLPTPVANAPLVWNATGTALVNGVMPGGSNWPFSLDAAGALTVAFNPASNGPRLEIQKDSAPVNYAGTRASLVFQHRDTADGANNEGIPAAVFLSTWDGDGVVTALPNFSATVGQGVLFAAEKYGDGSMHSISLKGQLWAGGAVGYNELALASGDITNRGSMNGYIVAHEYLLKDGTGPGVSGVANFPTAIQGFVSRIAKWNSAAAPNYPSVNFLASSEGTVAPDSILGINNGGLKQWKVGIDLRNGTYTTNAAIAFPNAAYLYTNDTGGTSRLFLGTNAANSNLIFANSNSGYFQLIAGDGATTLLEANLALDASNPMLLFVNGALKRVTAGAADSGGAGFRYLRVPN